VRGIYRRVSAVLVVLAIGLSACGGGPTSLSENVAIQVQPVVAQVSDLTLPAEVQPARVAELYDTGEIVIIDVREAWEYEAGHIPGATLIPLGELAGRVDEVPQDQPVVLVCRSDNRSGQAYRFLARQGFDKLSNMMGGMLAWEASGYDIAK
jgi:rhodanese-related sulfurtransferase